METEKLFNLYEKIQKTQTAVKNLPKNGFNKQGGYKYGLLSDIFNELKTQQELLKFTIIHRDSMTIEPMEEGNGKETMISLRYLKVYKIINTEKPEEKETIYIGAYGTNQTKDKAKGTAETYAYKYFLINLLELSEDELDSDSDNQNIKLKKEPIQSINHDGITISQGTPTDKQINYVKRLAKDNSELSDGIGMEISSNDVKNLYELLLLKGKEYLQDLINKGKS